MDVASIKQLFDTFSKSVPGLQKLLLITDDGFPILSTVDSEDEEVQSTAVGAILCDSGERGIAELSLGCMEAVITVGSEGYFVLTRVCAGTLFMAVASQDTPLGLVLFRVKRAVPAILHALEGRG